MTGFWVTVLTLLVASSALLLAAGGRKRASLAADRDTLNKNFYHQRLQELEQDEAQGVIAERPEMIRELQQTLLLDIPQAPPVHERTLSRWVLLPGVLVLIIVSLGLYFKTGGFAQVVAWQQVNNELPRLRAQLMDPQAKPLTLEQLARLGLGIRTSLQQDPRNTGDWLMLGRIGMVLNNAATATQAFRRAMQLAPTDPEVKLSYADALTRSQDPQDNRQATAMLNDMLKGDANNIRLLSLLAFNAFSQQRYTEAIATWQKMLQLLPADDKRGAAIHRSIEQAKTESGGQTSRLALSVTLAAGAEQHLPESGVLYIAVTDGVTRVPVAVKRVPLSHFPLSLTLDDSNAMMPERLLSAQHQVQVRVRISQDGSANPQSGDWFGTSAVTPFDGHQQLAIEINQQQP
ncbi:c-type cytochrome biogenesis protein CcmI [Erwinia sp.]|uniref:c-type cytochrome biogenesis protein CcmI n=1 Tax=Erwinia citreus TaxID=558 RepID=UPI0028996073|nr:c-type cytochrome biogenesis protein CcmI [Erwinia sp.]